MIKMIKKIKYINLLLIGSLIPFVASANMELAKSKNCFACHSIEKKVVGPSYKDVALKYQGKNYQEKLASKIMSGGAGSWGAIPMPENKQVSKQEANTLASWILSLK